MLLRLPLTRVAPHGVANLLLIGSLLTRELSSETRLKERKNIVSMWLNLLSPSVSHSADSSLVRGSL